MDDKLLEPKLNNHALLVCTKPRCGGTLFLPHEDGWQCFNYMKIIYKDNDKVKKKVSFKRYSRNN